MEVIEAILSVILGPWRMICHIFHLGKFENFVTEYPDPDDELYEIEPWHSGGVGNHADCERKWCPYHCRFRNF